MLSADLAIVVMSLPATNGFEMGSGFAGTYLTGSQHNDEMYRGEDGTFRNRTNRAGGTQGGISNGENIVIRVAFKPTATIRKEQKTVAITGQDTTLAGTGRHDPCVGIRGTPVVEAMMALVLADHKLLHRAQTGLG